MDDLKVLSNLEATIEQRSRQNSDASYSAKLLKGGATNCAKKFGEETTELIIASISQKDGEVISETADVLYHLLVLLRSRNISLQQVMDELQSRTSRSGLEEKASRQKP